MSMDAQCNPTTLQMFYSDEHAMTLGIREVEVITGNCGSNGSTTDYPFSPMASPGPTAQSAIPPVVGSTIESGDQAGTDTAGRPMFPVMYVTDVTANPGNPFAGDWQYGGVGIEPDAVFGSWKGAVRTVDTTTNPDTITVTPDADPPANNWNLGTGSDPVPTPTPMSGGYGAECRWNLSSFNFIPGHEYRLYFMVHDGDQNNSGGDVGQDCVYFTMPGAAPTATPSPTATATASATATATPATVVASDKTFAAKVVTVTFQNNTASSQVLSGLTMTWPTSPTNGNLNNIKIGGTAIYNPGGGNSTGTLTITSFPSNTLSQRTVAAGSCLTLTFNFAKNVATTASSYTGTATFSTFGPVPYLP
jgi:hypothetical protein